MGRKITIQKNGNLLELIVGEDKRLLTHAEAGSVTSENMTQTLGFVVDEDEAETILRHLPSLVQKA